MLTQTITEENELVNVANVSLEESLTAANIRDELFDQVNVNPTASDTTTTDTTTTDTTTTDTPATENTIIGGNTVDV